MLVVMMQGAGLISDSIASAGNDDESQSLNIALGNLTANFRFCPR